MINYKDRNRKIAKYLAVKAKTLEMSKKPIIFTCHEMEHINVT